MDTLTLTAEQSRAVGAHPNEPVHLIDPAGNRTYVLLPADVYDRVRDLLTDDPRDSYRAVDRAFAEGWDDPPMADYDRYEDLKR